MVFFSINIGQFIQLRIRDHAIHIEGRNSFRSTHHSYLAGKTAIFTRDLLYSVLHAIGSKNSRRMLAHLQRWF